MYLRRSFIRYRDWANAVKSVTCSLLALRLPFPPGGAWMLHEGCYFLFFFFSSGFLNFTVVSWNFARAEATVRTSRTLSLSLSLTLRNFAKTASSPFYYETTQSRVQPTRTSSCLCDVGIHRWIRKSCIRALKYRALARRSSRIIRPRQERTGLLVGLFLLFLLLPFLFFFFFLRAMTQSIDRDERVYRECPGKRWTGVTLKTPFFRRARSFSRRFPWRPCSVTLWKLNLREIALTSFRSARARNRNGRVSCEQLTRTTMLKYFPRKGERSASSLKAWRRVCRCMHLLYRYFLRNLGSQSDRRNIKLNLWSRSRTHTHIHEREESPESAYRPRRSARERFALFSY